MAVLRVTIIPNAAKTELVGRYGDGWKIRIAAPPVDGAANDELIAFLAKRLSSPKRDVIITSGKTSRRKMVTVPMDEASLEKTLSP